MSGIKIKCDISKLPEAPYSKPKVPERKKPLPTIETMAGTQKAIEADAEKRDTVPAPSDHMKKLRERLRA